MNARLFRVSMSLSELHFPAINGLGESSVNYHSEPHINKRNLVLTITNNYVLADMEKNIQHNVLSVKADYEVPCSLIRSREDVYEIYKDATLSLNEVYQSSRTLLPVLPNIVFPNQPIQSYELEIDRVFRLLDSQN
jgi:hypothetical protein